MRNRLLRVCLLGAATGLTTLSGCYERVVGAKGMGAQGVSISEPNGPKGSVTSTTTQKRTLKLNDGTPR
jgi:hypothetical protein